MRARNTPRRGPRQGDTGGGFSGPLILIHRNNCSNPASMRVTARFDFPGGVTFEEAEKLISWRLGIGSPLAHLVARRGSDGTA